MSTFVRIQERSLGRSWKRRDISGIEKGISSLEDHASLLLLAGAGQKGGTSGVLEDFTDALVRLGRALQVLVGTNLLADILTL